MRQNTKLRQDDGAVEWNEIAFSTCKGPFSTEVIRWRPERQRQRKIAYCLNSQREIRYMRALQGHSRRARVDRKLQRNVRMPYGWSDYIYHVGSSWDCRSIASAGLLLGGEHMGNRGRQTCFFTAVESHSMNEPREILSYEN